MRKHGNYGDQPFTHPTCAVASPNGLLVVVEMAMENGGDGNRATRPAWRAASSAIRSPSGGGRWLSRRRWWCDHPHAAAPAPAAVAGGGVAGCGTGRGRGCGRSRRGRAAMPCRAGWAGGSGSRPRHLRRRWVLGGDLPVVPAVVAGHQRLVSSAAARRTSSASAERTKLRPGLAPAVEFTEQSFGDALAPAADGWRHVRV